jgi:hypothetical protein
MYENGESYDTGPTALFPLWRKACCEFLSPSAGLNPRTLGPMASTLSVTPLRTTTFNLLQWIQKHYWRGSLWDGSNITLSPSLSYKTRKKNAEEMVLCSIVRLRETLLAHHPWTRIFQGVRKMGRPFYPGLLLQLKTLSIISTGDKKGAGQVMVPTGHTRTCFSLAQGCRSGRTVCEETRFGNKPSHLNMCHFLNFFSKYLLRKKWDITFWATLARFMYCVIIWSWCSSVS